MPRRIGLHAAELLVAAITYIGLQTIFVDLVSSKIKIFTKFIPSHSLLGYSHSQKREGV